MIQASVVLNPAAGRGAAARALDPIAREFHRQGWSVDVERTAGPGHGAELAARAVQAGGGGRGAAGGGGARRGGGEGGVGPRGGGGGGTRARGFAETGNMMMVEVCNGTTAGGSYRFAPDALPGDGRLDVCLVRRVSLLRFLMAVPRVMRGTHATMREVALFQTRQVTIRSLDGPLLLHLDGELREPDAHECSVRVEPGRLTVLVAQ